MALTQYQEYMELNGYKLDQDQRLIVSALDALSQKVGANPQSKKTLGSLMSQIFNGKVSRREPVKGCYIWGGVGRGKTWLMDMFYHSLVIKDKKRLHFNRFMQSIHQQLGELEHCADPLVTIAHNMAQQCRVLCLDEFHVSDITDAMLLGGILQELFHQGVVLVITSNLEPDQLYKNGLQRERFVPAIELIKQFTQVIKLDGELDHRANSLQRRPSYFLTDEIDYDQLRAYLNNRYGNGQSDLSERRGGLSKPQIEIAGRVLNTEYLVGRCIWFNFMEICGVGRATSDYIHIAHHYDCVVITDIPQLTSDLDDMTRRFIHLIDEFYDAEIHVVIGAQCMPTQLYQGHRLAQDFLRTASRLQEIALRKHL